MGLIPLLVALFLCAYFHAPEYIQIVAALVAVAIGLWLAIKLDAPSAQRMRKERSDA